MENHNDGGANDGGTHSKDIHNQIRNRMDDDETHRNNRILDRL